ncbi:MAG: uracil-DNA glycosylase [Pseudomonadota bacterium]
MVDAEQQAAKALLRWYADMGVEECVGSSPADFYAWGGAAATAPEPFRLQKQSTPVRVFKPSGQDAETPPADEAIAAAQQAAQKCQSFQELEAAVLAFDGCPLKAGATKTVFADGVPGADLLVIGEGPGRDEDRIGKPFVGRAGRLLDKMLASIGRSRLENVLISNVVYWRPPGNRTPTPVETAICRPFVDRLIEITAPKVVLLAGGAPLTALLDVTGIMRARGVWRDLETASGHRTPALPIFHPAFLLRQPANKRLAWADLQTLAARLTDD